MYVHTKSDNNKGYVTLPFGNVTREQTLAVSRIYQDCYLMMTEDYETLEVLLNGQTLVTVNKSRYQLSNVVDTVQDDLRLCLSISVGTDAPSHSLCYLTAWDALVAPRFNVYLNERNELVACVGGQRFVNANIPFGILNPSVNYKELVNLTLRTPMGLLQVLNGLMGEMYGT